MIRTLFLALLLALPGLGAAVERSEAGNASVRNFRPRDYAGQSQNWAVVQDLRGIIYVANGEGVLEFDGDRWRLIPTPNRTVVRSLAMDGNGRIYVGAVGEVGYLAPDRQGRMAYVSLNDRIDSAHASFGDVWKIHPTTRGVYFFSSDFIFLLGPGVFRSWQAETPLHLAFGIGERFLVQQLGVGLLESDGERLTPLPGGERFSQDKIYFILPWGQDGRLLVGTRAQGLLVYDRGTWTPFPTQADAFLKANLLYQGVQLRDGTLALGTLQGGVALLGADGRLHAILNKASGLLSSTIYALYADRQAGLWMGLGSGIARVQWPAAFSQFDASTGLDGTVLSVHRHGSELFVGTSQGVYILDPRTPDRIPNFHPVTGLKAQTWRLLSSGSAVLAGNYQGVYQIRNGKGVLAQPAGNNVLSLRFDPEDPQRVFVGQLNGLASLRRTGADGWIDEGLYPGIHESIGSLEDAGNGRLWLGTTAFGPLRVSFPRGREGSPVVERFGTAHGLPPKKLVNVEKVGGVVVFTTNSGVFRFEEATRRFLPDPRFASLFQDGPRRVVLLREDAAGRVWLQTLDEIRHAYDLAVGSLQADGSFQWERAPFLRFNNLELNDIYPEANGVVWFGGAEGLFRYDPAVPADMVLPFAAHVRQVSTTGDRVLSAGGDTDLAEPRLGPGDNLLRFEYSTTSFDSDWANRYSIRLEGRDPDWSGWTATPFKEYSYLPEGSYRFRVRARNVYGTVSREDSFGFRILPPWYRTWWARLLLLGLVTGGAAVGHRTLTRLLRLRNQNLQRRIQEATGELVERERLLATQAGDLERANGQLLAMNEQKNQFIGIVAHDLRNPLNGIMLASERLAEGGGERETARTARMILSECQEMDDLIGRFLDIAAIEAGTIQPAPVPCDLAGLAAQVVERHAVMAEQKGIQVQLQAAADTALALADPSFAKEILDNLLSNALKFSPRGASVRLALGNRADRVLLTVQDQGPGLTEEDLAKLFSRFAKLSALPTAGERSLGLGLSIVKHMVDALGGRIWVEATPGRGATFQVEFPRWQSPEID